MQSGIPIGTNPLLETMMFGDGSKDMTEEMQEYREKQKGSRVETLRDYVVPVSLASVLYCCM